MFKRDNLAQKAAAAVALATPFLANATVDVTDITATLTDIAAVGAAVFSVFVGVKLYKWVRRAL